MQRLAKEIEWLLEPLRGAGSSAERLVFERRVAAIRALHSAISLEAQARERAKQGIQDRLAQARANQAHASGAATGSAFAQWNIVAFGALASAMEGAAPQVHAANAALLQGIVRRILPGLENAAPAPLSLIVPNAQPAELRGLQAMVRLLLQATSLTIPTSSTSGTAVAAGAGAGAGSGGVSTQAVRLAQRCLGAAMRVAAGQGAVGDLLECAKSLMRLPATTKIGEGMSTTLDALRTQVGVQSLRFVHDVRFLSPADASKLPKEWIVDPLAPTWTQEPVNLCCLMRRHPGIRQMHVNVGGDDPPGAPHFRLVQGCDLLNRAFPTASTVQVYVSSVVNPRDPSYAVHMVQSVTLRRGGALPSSRTKSKQQTAIQHDLTGGHGDHGVFLTLLQAVGDARAPLSLSLVETRGKYDFLSPNMASETSGAVAFASSSQPARPYVLQQAQHTRPQRVL